MSGNIEGINNNLSILPMIAAIYHRKQDRYDFMLSAFKAQINGVLPSSVLSEARIISG